MNIKPQYLKPGLTYQMHYILRIEYNDKSKKPLEIFILNFIDNIHPSELTHDFLIEHSDSIIMVGIDYYDNKYFLTGNWFLILDDIGEFCIYKYYSLYNHIYGNIVQWVMNRFRNDACYNDVYGDAFYINRFKSL